MRRTSIDTRSLPKGGSARAVLFDLDGTLLDSYQLITSAFRHACTAVLGREVSDAEVTSRWGQPLSDRFAAIAAGRIPELVAAYTDFYSLHVDQLAALFPGVREMLGQLAERGLRLGVVTSKRRASTAEALEKFGLRPFIRVAVSAEDVDAPKPAPDPIVLAAKQLGAASEETWMVGDGVLDMQAARAAGAASVAAVWGTRERDALLASDPDYVAERPEDVVEILSS